LAKLGTLVTVQIGANAFKSQTASEEYLHRIHISKEKPVHIQRGLAKKETQPGPTSPATPSPSNQPAKKRERYFDALRSLTDKR
jgi:heme-binding NEAT domain protein